MAVADRIIVLSEGRLIDEFSGEEVNEDALMKAALPQDSQPHIIKT